MLTAALRETQTELQQIP